MKIAIIGAGWAGLCAAWTLKQAGYTPTVFEAAPIAGGRARRVDDKNMGAIDNGQHLLIGAYRETLKLIEELHPRQKLDALLLRMPMQIENATGRFRLRTRRLPPPLHALAGLIQTTGLSLGERWQALRMMASLKLKTWRCPALQTVDQLLDHHKQSEHIRKHLWYPLCLATLNTPAQFASGQLFLNVLRDSLDAARTDSDLIVPRVDLSALWSEKVASQCCMRYRHIVRKVKIDASQVSVDDEHFDACIIATPPYATARLLEVAAHAEQLDTLRDELHAFTYRPIATLTLQLAQDWRLPFPLLMLDENFLSGHYGQWVFERAQHNQLTVVISDSQDFLKYDREIFVNQIAEQVRQQVGLHSRSRTDMPEVISHRLIIEKRATFSAIPGLRRPANQTAWPRLTLAGDWTDTSYPAVLEGAVLSGKQAAGLLLENIRSNFNPSRA